MFHVERHKRKLKIIFFNMENEEKEAILLCKDHTVSGEVFQLHHDKKYEMLVTFPRPDLSKLSSYYKSEDYISHTDAKRSLFEKIYHLVKKYALRKKVNQINSFAYTSKYLLDIGAGTGDFLLAAKNNKWNVFGIEPDISARALATKKGIHLEENTKELPDHNFDTITMWHVLEHVPDISFQMKELKRLLKTNGTIFIAVPNYKSLDAKTYKEFWAAYDVPRHLWHFSQASISKLMNEYQMKVEKILPMKFDAYYVSLLSEKYKNKKMNFFTAFYNGFKSNMAARRTNEYSSLIYVVKNA